MDFEPEIFMYIRAGFDQEPLTWSQQTEEESGQTKNTKTPAAEDRWKLTSCPCSLLTQENEYT